jgi:hypothetical protein
MQYFECREICHTRITQCRGEWKFKYLFSLFKSVKNASDKKVSLNSSILINIEAQSARLLQLSQPNHILNLTQLQPELG